MALTAACTAPSLAQNRIPIDIEPVASETLEAPEIDILAPPPEQSALTPAEVAECEEQVEASEISGEIVVCRKRRSGTPDWFSGNREDWLRNYAERTQNINTIPAPDVDNTHHPFSGTGVGFVLTGCFIPPCPGPHPLLVDVEGLPPPPPGSDAERVSLGFAPRGNDGEPSEEERARREAELALPPPAFEGD
ncbi:MAG: hypothetical protein AAFO28_06250 [Pseudomonadota bacterium]